MSEKQAYHHGNLRQALVDAAVRILEAEGLSALSLRRIARDVGVSQAAPYSHFKDKSELLQAVCSAGHEIFYQRMVKEAGDSEGPAYIAGLGRGYIYFALENPALFELMFSGNLLDNPEVPDPGSDPANGQGYRLLDEGLARYPIPLFPADGTSRALSWGVVHGLASLLLGQKMSAEQFGYDSLHDFIRDSMDRFVGA